MDENQKLLSKIKEQEEYLRFTAFDNRMALELGLILIELGKKQKKPITIDITKNGQQVFHYAFDGTSPDNDQWIIRKSNVVTRFHTSSLFMGTKLKIEGKTIEEKYHISSMAFAPYGGAFPLYIKNVGVVGTVTVSGLKQVEDHELVVEAIGKYLRILKEKESLALMED
ncbi:MAG: heme-degrading domain-containing protein [Bacillota bacterium]